jgi:hypothetical protein
MDRREPAAPPLPALLQWLSDKLDVAVREQPLTGYEPLRAYYVDLSRFRLRLSDHTPCIDIPAGVLRLVQPAQLKRLLGDLIITQGWRRRNVLALIKADAAELKLLTRSDVLPLLIIDAEAQERILAGPPNSNALVEEISRQAPISALSPYETSAPVTGPQFFGREHELRLILRNTSTNYLAVGNRRMGKTSLVREAVRRMKHEAEDNSTYAYFDCSVFHEQAEFYREIVREVDGPREVDRVFSDYTFSIQSFVQRMARARKSKIVLVLDEIDRLLEWDGRDNWSTVSTLRAITIGAQSRHGDGSDDDERPVRLLMAGFRRAQELFQREDTPLFNFVTLMRVGPFEFKDTEQLVMEPMLNLGLRVPDRNAIVERIHKETGGQPNLIQHYCQFIVRRLEDTGGREVTQALLDEILDDDTVRRRTTVELLTNASNLEQLIVFCFIEDCWKAGQSEQFTLADLDGWLHKRGFQLPRSDLERALDSLDASGVLSRKGRHHGFTLQILPRMLLENYDLDYQIRKIAEEGT